MHFRLTYEGELLAHRDDKRLPERALHVHRIRKQFHKQLSNLWRLHPVLKKERAHQMGVIGTSKQRYDREGFLFEALVNEDNGLICGLDVLLLREGAPGEVLFDIDNKLKTIFDALRLPKNVIELGGGSTQGAQKPESDGSENPFFVLLEDDKLITHLTVESDILLEPVKVSAAPGSSVRLVLSVTVRPYDVGLKNLAFA